MIPYGRQSIDEDDVEAVTTVLRGDWLTQGPAVEEFEAAVSAATEAKHAVAFCNGTAALHSACAAGGLGPGDRVGTSTLSFVASANCVKFVGAEPVLLDIDPATLNADLSAAPQNLEGLVVVHYAGLPTDLSALRSRPRVVIEDAAHALGAQTPDGPVGNCAWSDMCCFSFHPVKAITTGEGGVVTTNDDVLEAKLRRFRSHGTVRAPEIGGWAYDVVELGWNYRLPDLQATLGASQMKKLEKFVVRRNDLADRYRSLLAGHDVALPPAAPPGTRHAYHLFAVQVAGRKRVYDELRSKGIGVQVHYIPIHHHSLYRHDGINLPHADAAADRLLSLPLYPLLSEDDQDTVVDELLAAVSA